MFHFRTGLSRISLFVGLLFGKCVKAAFIAPSVCEFVINFLLFAWRLFEQIRLLYLLVIELRKILWFDIVFIVSGLVESRGGEVLLVALGENIFGG